MSWDILVTSWDIFGTSWDILGTSWQIVRTSWDILDNETRSSVVVNPLIALLSNNYSYKDLMTGQFVQTFKIYDQYTQKCCLWSQKYSEKRINKASTKKNKV